MGIKRKRTFSESFLIENHLRSCDALQGKVKKPCDLEREEMPEPRLGLNGEILDPSKELIMKESSASTS
jgi:hypothetical protein